MSSSGNLKYQPLGKPIYLRQVIQVRMTSIDFCIKVTESTDQNVAATAIVDEVLSYVMFFENEPMNFLACSFNDQQFAQDVAEIIREKIVGNVIVSDCTAFSSGYMIEIQYLY